MKPVTHRSPAPHVADRGTFRVKPPRAGFGPIYKIDPSTGCWIWQRSLERDGYGYFRSGGKIIRAARYFYELHKGPLPSGILPDHTCRNRACVNPDHLEAVTHVENCRRGGLVKTGMTIEKAREIRRLRAEGVSYAEISAQFGIGKSLVAQIATGRCWKDYESDAHPHTHSSLVRAGGVR